MKAKMLVALFAAAFAAAGCARKGKVSVVFNGATAATAAVKKHEQRWPEFSCPACGKKIDDFASSPKLCPDKKNCGAQLEWTDDVPCAYCGASGNCPTCKIMRQEGGQCYNCRGAKSFILEGKTANCPNCKGTGLCPTCEKDPGKCDFCHGEKKVKMNVLQQEATKHATAGGPAPEK